MLLELKVKDFAIIDSVQIRFQEGLNILSGETGAGKSVLLKSLALLMGGKSSPETVRTGAEQAIIEGYFDISDRTDITTQMRELGIAIEDDVLVVRRIISAQGKSRIYLNESLTTLTNLQNIVCPLIEVTGQTAPLIEITGQHENRSLMSPSYHLDLLDQYVGTLPARGEYYKNYQNYLELVAQKEELLENSKSRAQKLDYLKFQHDEISALNLSAEEDTQIENEYQRVKNSARLYDYAEVVENTLYGDDDSAIARIQIALQRTLEVAQYDASLKNKVETLESAKSLLQEFLYDVQQHMRGLDADPEKLQQIEARMSELRKLQRKYGSSVEEILAAFEKMSVEISDLENLEKRLSSIDSEIAQLTRLLEKQAADLHSKRTKGAVVLTESVNDELADLNMKGLIFEVYLQKAEQLGVAGFTEIEFMTRTSKKDEARSLAKFASGGELSRILLALKQVVGGNEQKRTYLFDEVDTGVSGPTAEKVGKKLKAIAYGGEWPVKAKKRSAPHQQVICVTHLPQVAAFGDVHFYIQKNQTAKGAEMQVQELKKEARIDEIARLISGEKITKTSLAHAKELLAEAQHV